MKQLTPYLPYLIAAVLLVLGTAAWLALRLRAPASLDYQRRALLTPNEAEFRQRLCNALPGLLVLPQVALSGLIEPRAEGQARLAAFRRISQKRVDFVIARADLSVLCVIELDDRTHNKRRDAERDRMLESAGIPTLRYDSRRKPDEAALARAVAQLDPPDVMAQATVPGALLPTRRIRPAPSGERREPTP